MTLQDCISRVDNQLPNQYTTEEKINWLAHLDAKIRHDVIDKHLTLDTDGTPVTLVEFKPYTLDSMTEELIAPFPHDELYISYLKSKIFETNEESNRYNNEAITFNELMSAFAKEYHKEHPWADDVQYKYW